MMYKQIYENHSSGFFKWRMVYLFLLLMHLRESSKSQQKMKINDAKLDKLSRRFYKEMQTETVLTWMRF